MCKISLGLCRDATLAQRGSNHRPHGPSEAGRVWICVSSPLSLPSVLSIFSAVLSYEGKNAKQIIFKKSCVDALIYCCGHRNLYPCTVF